MDNRLIIAFCPACQSLFAPWGEACPACAEPTVAVWVTDAPPDLIAAIARHGIEAESTDSHRSDGPVASDTDDIAPVLDLDVLETMSEAVGEDVMPDLIEEGVREMSAIVVELGDGADLAALRRAAHDLKSSSGSFGAVRLQRLAQELELVSGGNQAADARGLVEEIAPVGEQAFETLEARSRRGFTRPVDRAVND